MISVIREHCKVNLSRRTVTLRDAVSEGEK